MHLFTGRARDEDKMKCENDVNCHSFVSSSTSEEEDEFEDEDEAMQEQTEEYKEPGHVNKYEGNALYTLIWETIFMENKYHS